MFLLRLTLPGAITAFAGVQALWWLAAAIALIVRSPSKCPCDRVVPGAGRKQAVWKVRQLNSLSLPLCQRLLVQRA